MRRALTSLRATCSTTLKQTTTVCLAGGSQIKGMLYIMRELSRPYPPGKRHYRGIQEAYLDLGLGLEINRPCSRPTSAAAPGQAGPEPSAHL